jgi:hypothetical protein
MNKKAKKKKQRIHVLDERDQIGSVDWIEEVRDDVGWHRQQGRVRWRKHSHRAAVAKQRPVET